MAVDSGYATQDVYGFVRNHPQAVWGGNGADPERVESRYGRKTPWFTGLERIRPRSQDGALPLAQAGMAERRVIRVVKGFPHATWEKDPNRNNEALDCRVYARAAATIYGIDRISEFKWRSLEQSLGVEAEIPTRGVEIPVTEEAKAEPPKPQTKKRVTVPQREAVRASDPYL